jgi:hypothetical protein
VEFCKATYYLDTWCIRAVVCGWSLLLAAWFGRTSYEAWACDSLLYIIYNSDCIIQTW